MNPETIVRYFFTTIAIILLAFLLYYFYRGIRIKVQTFILFLGKKKREYKKYLYLVRRNDGKTLSWVFDSFVYFYENSYKPIEHKFAVDEYYFPNGKIDIVNAYRYITKYRKDNIEEEKSLIVSDCVEVFGSRFNSYKIKTDPERRIHIIPSDNASLVHTQMVHANTLYNFDNEVCAWIIERRKIFEI